MSRRLATSTPQAQEFLTKLREFQDTVSRTPESLGNTSSLWLAWRFFYLSAQKWSEYVIAKLEIPPRAAKPVEMAARLFSKEYGRGKGPKSIHKWYADNVKRFELLELATRWEIRSEGSGMFQHGPWTVHNTVHAAGKELDNAKLILDKATRFSRQVPLPGFAGMAYGDLFLVGQIARKSWAAWFVPAKDVIYLRPVIRGISTDESARHLVHEMAHRYWLKKLPREIQTAWRRYHLEMGLSRPRPRIPDPGYEFPSWFLVDNRPVKYTGMDGGLAVMTDAETGSEIGKVNPMRLMDWVQQAEDRGRYPTLYAASDAEEHFCESVSLIGEGKLEGANLEAFERIVLGQVSSARVANRHLAKTFQLNVGDPILYGKYKNKRGIIKEFKTDEKSGDPIVVIEPDPKGRKQDQELKLFKIRYDESRAEAEKTAGVFEAPPGLMEAYLKWALPVYAGHVLHRAEAVRQTLMDRTRPLREALDDLDKSLSTVSRVILDLKEGEVAQWTYYEFRSGMLKPMKIGVKNDGKNFKGDFLYLTDIAEKRLTFKRGIKLYTGALEWVRQLLVRNIGELDRHYQLARNTEFEDGPGLVEATLLVREAKKYATKAKDYKTQAKTILPISESDLQNWKYWQTAMSGMRKSYDKMAKTLIALADKTDGEYVWFPQYSAEKEYARYFGVDPYTDVTPDELRKAAQRPFDEGDVAKLLKQQGWEKIEVALVFQGHQSRGGVWFEHKRLLEVDVPRWGRPNNVEEFQAGIDEITRIARHEFQHVGQDMLKNLLGAKEELGLPSLSIRDPSRTPTGYPRDLTERNPQRDEHAVQDVEFYTRLADEIDKFARNIKRVPKDQWRDAMRIWVGLAPKKPVKFGPLTLRPAEFFAVLKRKQPEKWKKAVSEFVKGVGEAGVRIPSAGKVASQHLAQEALLPIMDPLFNVREFCKQLILLEDHLQIDGKRCLDCIRKHTLAAEALAEEAISLDTNRRYYSVLSSLPGKMQAVWRMVQDKQYLEAAAECRKVRKPLMLLCSAVRVASLWEQRNSFNKEGCIVAVGEWGGSRVLLKNRDRNYTPKLRVYHEVREGTEILYIQDEVTGWIEGMNEHGIAIVNSALAVARDEAEKKLVKTVGKKSKDGERILKALEQKTLDEAIAIACEYKGGIKGHTFVSDPNKTVSIEQTSKHECVVKTVSSGKVHVRTNHGFFYDDAGYTDGDNYASSVYRRNRAKKVLRDVENPEDIGPALFADRKEDGNGMSMVRKTDNMRTTSQLVMDVTKKQLWLYLLPDVVEFDGFEDNMPKGRKKTLKIEVFRYEDKEGAVPKPVR